MQILGDKAGESNNSCNLTIATMYIFLAYVPRFDVIDSYSSGNNSSSTAV